MAEGKELARIEDLAVWVYRQKFDSRGRSVYGTDRELSRLPSIIRSDSSEDRAKDIVGSKILNVEYPERVELVEYKERWFPPQQLVHFESPFPEEISKKAVRDKYIIIGHRRLDAKPEEVAGLPELFLVYEYFYSQREIHGRPGDNYIKAFLLNERNHDFVMDKFRSAPRYARFLFNKVAPDLAKKHSLEGEVERPLVLMSPL